GGWLEQSGGGYRLTTRGRAATDAMYAAARNKLATLAPLPPADLERLAVLLRRLLAGCQSSRMVTCQACLAASGRAVPWQEPTPAGCFALTAAGRAMRLAVEDQTDANFYGPWLVLSAAELDELTARSRAVLNGLKSA